MKLSFSLSSKPSSKQQSNLKPSQTFNDETNDASSTAKKQFVTEFDPSKTLTDGQPKKLVIPPKPNEWRPHKKMKNLDLPVRSDAPDLRFEVDPTSAPEHLDSTMSYGLNVRQSTKDSAGGDYEAEERRPRSEPVESMLLQKLKDDLKRLPEDRGLDEFADVPVEGFGAALLAGYGWHEGRGIGRNAKEDVKVVQYERRTAKEGLGFHSAKVLSEKREKEQRSNREEKKEDGSYYVGKDVRIVSGRDMGLKGSIVEVMGNGDSAVLKLSKSEEEVKVRIRDVAELGSLEEEKCLKKLRELKIRGSEEEIADGEGRRRKDSSSSRSHTESRDERTRDIKENKRNREEGRRGDRRDELGTSPPVSWLTSHIRVRIVSEKLGKKLYLKKGEVVDVVGPTTCDISIDDSRELIQGVDQGVLETALPRRGGPVLVLYGKHKGVYGSLVEKDTQNETGVVRDADTHALLNVRLGQIAEYIGDPSYIGY